MDGVVKTCKPGLVDWKAEPTVEVLGLDTHVPRPAVRHGDGVGAGGAESAACVAIGKCTPAIQCEHASTPSTL